jgi:hypothetical protein
VSDLSKKRNADDPFFSDRGSPALMSLKEPALRLLRERYSETFAITVNREKKQVHLFLIKFGLWSLVRTFVPKDLVSEEIEISGVLGLLENALNESDSGKSLLVSLDNSVKAAKERILSKAQEYGIKDPAEKGI